MVNCEASLSVSVWTIEYCLGWVLSTMPGNKVYKDQQLDQYAYSIGLDWTICWSGHVEKQEMKVEWKLETETGNRNWKRKWKLKRKHHRCCSPSNICWLFFVPTHPGALDLWPSSLWTFALLAKPCFQVFTFPACISAFAYYLANNAVAKTDACKIGPEYEAIVCFA